MPLAQPTPKWSHATGGRHHPSCEHRKPATRDTLTLTAAAANPATPPPETSRGRAEVPDRRTGDPLVGIDLNLLAPFATRHHGLVTRQVARSVGISDDAWYRATRAGVLPLRHPGVAARPGHPSPRHRAVLAAVLALTHVTSPPDIVVASHRSAAFLLGLERPTSDPIDITVSSSHIRSLDGVVIHRPTDRGDLSPTYRKGIMCTNELRTLVDLGAVDPTAVATALDVFSVNRKITPAMVTELLLRHGRPGRDGVGALRAALEAWPLGDQIPDSELELAMARLLRGADLPPARFHAHVAGHEVDFLIEGTGVVVECDGWTYHVGDRRQWERDLDRDAAMHAAGFVVLRRSRRQVLFEPRETADLIRSLIDRPATASA